jgi:predicted CxxxxCH...CXXCH cytochrome family protein
MSSIKTSLAVILLVFGLALSGCGEKNSQVIFNSDDGSHPTDWVQKHWVEARKAGTVGSIIDWANSPCIQCHGVTLTGGISAVSCFSANREAQTCHAGGPNGASGGHGLNWGSPALHGTLGAKAKADVSAGFAYCSKCHGSTFDNGDAVSCKYCHGTAPHPPRPWHGTTASDTNHVTTDPSNADQCFKCHKNGNNYPGYIPPAVAPAAGTAPGCFNNTLCHGASHVPGWTNNPASPQFHSNTAKISTSCVFCHGANYDGVGGTAPSCMNTNSITGLKCHSNGIPVGIKASGCTSCHSTPPNGAVTPNVKGSHDKHTAIQDVTCSACHNNAGSGTANHAKGIVNFSFLPTYKAKKSGAANPLTNSDFTCENISCHGGKKTPVWGTTNGLACTSCHEQGTAYQVPEYNSYYSGSYLGQSQHLRHLARTNPGSVRLITCTDCHDTAKLTRQQHFGGLAAHLFVFPGNTIGAGTTRIGSYNTSTQSCSAVSCHTGVPQDNIHWYNF